MAAPQHWREVRPAEPWIEERRTSGQSATKRAERRIQLGRRRRFWVLVVLPVALMLGSVYLHTVSANLNGRISALREDISRSEAKGQGFEVRVSELSSPGRVRSMASERLGMKEPSGSDMKLYGGNGEDGKNDAREKISNTSQ